MRLKKHLGHFARVGRKASINFAKRFGTKLAGHTLIGGGAAVGGAIGTAIGGPAGTATGSLVGGAFGHEIGSTLAGAK